MRVIVPGAEQDIQVRNASIYIRCVAAASPCLAVRPISASLVIQFCVCGAPFNRCRGFTKHYYIIYWHKHILVFKCLHFNFISIIIIIARRVYPSRPPTDSRSSPKGLFDQINRTRQSQSEATRRVRGMCIIYHHADKGT